MSIKDGRCLNLWERLTSICRWKMLERTVLFWESSESRQLCRTVLLKQAVSQSLAQSLGNGVVLRE